MISLCIDTAYKYLTVCLIKDNTIVKSISEECFKRQSEEVFVKLDELFKECDIKKREIDAICISKGPGSYTGVRIAMSIAKVYCEVKKIKLYTISTLRLYAGGEPNSMVVMDARANRAYVGVYNNNDCIVEDHAIELDKIDTKDYNVILDGSLLGKENVNPDIPNCFLKTIDVWTNEENINFVTPSYLKESDSYYR